MIIRNLLARNPGFETGDMTGWSTTGWSKPPSVQAFDAQHGSYEMTLYPIATGLSTLVSSPCPVPTTLTQIVAVVTLTSDGTLKTDTDPTLGLSVDGRLINKPIGVVGSWHTYASVITVPSGAASMQWRLALYNPGVASFVRVDGAGLYTADDWAALQSLGLDYFDGGTMPLAS